MKKLLFLLFPLCSFAARIPIEDKTVNGQTATWIDVRVINYNAGNSTSLIYYAYYNSSGVQIGEGNSTSSVAITGDFETAVETAIGTSTSSVKLLMHSLYSTLYKFEYITTAGLRGYVDLNGNFSTNDPSIKTNVFTALGVTESSGPTYTATTVEGVVNDDGGTLGYNAFAFTKKLNDGSIFTAWKRSSSHAAGEQIQIGRTIDGGLNWPHRQATVGGVGVGGYALGMGISSNYVHLVYQDDGTYQTMKFARATLANVKSNFNAFTFSASTTITFTSGWTSSPFGDILVMPSGKLIQLYYTISPTSNRTIMGTIVSTDEGATWNFESIIRDSQEAGAFNGYLSLEPDAVIVEMGATDTTTKLVCLSRLWSSPSNTYFMHHRSLGGRTWITDQTNFMYQFGNSNGSPVDMTLHGDSVIISNGARYGFEAYKLQYVSITPAAFYTNTQVAYSPAQTLPYTVNANTGAGGVHFGYSKNFHDWAGKLWTHFYDISPSAVDETRTMLYQIKIKDAP